MANAPHPNRNLLVLDLDETLIYACEEPLARSADFRVFDYHVYRRPHLEHFLKTVSQHFELAVWSSASDDYVARVTREIFPADIKLQFVWGRSKASLRRIIADENFSGDPSNHLNYRKQLAKLKPMGWRLENVLILDDTPAKSAQNYGNAIYPREWGGQAGDDELLLLAEYLPSLASCENLRRVEKRNWRSKVVNGRLG